MWCTVWSSSKPLYDLSGPGVVFNQLHLGKSAGGGVAWGMVLLVGGAEITAQLGLGDMTVCGRGGRGQCD